MTRLTRAPGITGPVGTARPRPGEGLAIAFPKQLPFDLVEPDLQEAGRGVGGQA